MAYTIIKSDLTTLTTIADGTRDTTTSLSLAGPNFVGYGQYLNQNLVYLLENFASNSAPSSVNLQGQLWFDKYNQILKVFTNQGYVPVSGVTNSGSQPAQGKDGDIWYNTTTEQMYLYDSNGSNAGFKLVGPVYTKQTGVTGAVAATIEDGSLSGTYHNILKLQFGNVTYATVSKDSAFIPTPPLPGFTMINPGITFSSNVVGPTINANVTGTVTGALVGNVTGNVTATTLTGRLTGNVIGTVTGNVVATTLSGNLTGNVTSINTHTDNFNSANAVITGGYVNNLANLTTTALTTTNSQLGTAQANNFSSPNVHITGGTANGLTTLSATTAQTTNFSSSNVLILGGSVTGLTALSATTAQTTNFSSSNVLVQGGQINSLSALSATTGQVTNLTTSNLQATGGSVTGLTTIAATTGQVTNLTTSNLQATGGNVSNTVGANVTLTNSVVNNSTATTKSASDTSTAIATTAFVHSVLPTGVILMWGGSQLAIPTGWQLCDGSNSTPDLRNLFIVGAGGTYSVGATGGSNSVTLDATQMPVHSHTQQGTFTSGTGGSHSHTVSDPGHSHSYLFREGGSNPWWQYNNTLTVSDTSTRTTSSSGTGITVNTAADHTHTVTLSGATANAGGTSGTAQSHENRPPFYALCYIQKMY